MEYQVNSDFKGDWMKNYQERLPPMLEAGIPVLIYAGDCGTHGHRTTSSLLSSVSSQ
jgi:carboxypeptidase C (cathepsin A)